MTAYPVVIVQDRYGGVYSKGKWLAVNEADSPARIDVIWNGPLGGDIPAMEFWFSPPTWIAVGNTPDEALAALIEKVGP